MGIPGRGVCHIRAISAAAMPQARQDHSAPRVPHCARVPVSRLRRREGARGLDGADVFVPESVKAGAELVTLAGSQSRRRPETHRRGQPLQSGARNAKNAPESAICGALRKRSAPTGSVLWLAPISSPRKRASHGRWINLRSSDDFTFQLSAFQPFRFLLRGQSSNVCWVFCWRGELFRGRQWPGPA